MSRAKRLIVNADGLGTPGVNEGVFEARRHGILTSSTLAVNQPAAAAAAEAARQATALGVGLHVAFSGGAAALPPDQIPSLADGRGQLPAERLLGILHEVPLGTTELMCHPARGPALEALLNREVRQAIQAVGIRLIHFGELAPR